MCTRGWVGVLAVLALWVPGAAGAEVRRGELVEVGAQEVVSEDLYVAARQVRVLGVVRGDLVVVAQQLELTGVVEGDVLAAVEEARLAGAVEGSARVAASELVLSGRAGTDVLLAGAELQVAQGARVEGDAYLAAGEALLQGEVGRDVHAAAGELVLSGPVAGEVVAQVGALRLTEGAVVGGALRYTSPEPAQVAEAAQVRGPVEYRQLEERERGVWMWLYAWLRSVVALFVLGLLVVLVSPRFASRVPEVLRRSPWQSLGWGVVLLVGVPVLAVLVLAAGALVGGWWLGLALLGLYLLALALCFPVVGLWLGRWLLGRVGRAGVHVAVALLAGVALLTLVRWVPVLGAVVWLATLLFGLGAMLLAALRLRQPAAA